MFPNNQEQYNQEHVIDLTTEDEDTASTVLFTPDRPKMPPLVEAPKPNRTLRRVETMRIVAPSDEESENVREIVIKIKFK